jgi:hypothetical protein
MTTSMSIPIDAFNHQQDMEFLCESCFSGGERVQALINRS